MHDQIEFDTSNPPKDIKKMIKGKPSIYQDRNGDQIKIYQGRKHAVTIDGEQGMAFTKQEFVEFKQNASKELRNLGFKEV